jgi:TonB family protein
VVDEETLRLTRDRRAYAEALLAFSAPQPHLPGVTSLIGRRQLSQRISLIAEEDRMSRRRVLAGFAIALFTCSVATASAVSLLPMAAVTAQSTKVYRAGDGITLPAVVYEVKPKYTPEAMKQKIQGSVFMLVVVRESGSVGEVQVTQSLDAEYGLDEEAVKAARQWIFRPGMKDGKAVAVEVTLQMTFTLRK